MIYKAEIKDSDLAPPIQYCRTFKQYQEILNFRHIEYNKHLNQVNGQPDAYDCRSHLLFTRDTNGKIGSTMRIAADSELRLPLESVFGVQAAHLRLRGFKLLELGRYHTLRHESSPALLKAYYSSIVTIAEAEQADAIIIAMQHRHIKFHQNLIGIEIVDPLLETNFGSTEKYATVVWNIKETKPAFFDWLQKS